MHTGTEPRHGGVKGRAVMSALAMLLAGCSTGPSASTPPPLEAAEACPSTPEELQYGCGPAADSNLTYQPDVVLIGTGARAIRESSRDGLTWTIDGMAPGADQIAPERVLFVTDQVVGRVLEVEPAGADLAVTLGPVDMGEVIRDGEVRWEAPLSIEDARPVVAPDMVRFGVEEVAAASGRSTGGPIRLGSTPEWAIALPPLMLLGATEPQAVTIPVADAAPPVEVDFGPDAAAQSICCVPKNGVAFSARNGQVGVDGAMWLRLEDAVATGFARFKDGKLVDGRLVVSGVTGLHVEFKAASETGGPPTNFDRRYLMPVEWQARPAPKKGERQLFNSVWQAQHVQTAFSAGGSTLEGAADYDFKGSTLAASFTADDITDITVPSGFTTRTPLLDTLTGLSVGVNGVVVGLVVQFCMCLGTLVQSNGLFFQLEATVGVTNDSSAVALLGARCRSVVFVMDAAVGNGRHLFESFADKLNADRAGRGKKPIAATAGWIERIPMWNESASFPAGIRRCT